MVTVGLDGLADGWLAGWLPWPGSERTADTKPRLHSKIGVGWLDCLAGQIGWLAEPLAKQLAYLRRQIQALLEDWFWLVGLAGWWPGWLATLVGCGPLSQQADAAAERLPLGLGASSSQQQ